MSTSEPSEPSEPTHQMVEFFEQRTRAHIARVADNLKLLMDSYEPHRKALGRRAITHDASKFGQVERVPYIWLTEYHRCRGNGVPFSYPVGVEDKVKAAVRHHVTVNRHHADYHASPDDMSEVDLIEMVCDWTAMAQEYEGNGGSARSWADKTIGAKVVFSPENVRFIYQAIYALDQAVAAQSN